MRATHITLEVNNIGLWLKFQIAYQFQVSEENTIYLHYHIREDAHELYRFKDATTLDMFESLINVKGLGPKGTLAILASSTPNEIVEALNNSNAKFFSSFQEMVQN
ncbi:MAG: OB-fold domain-containing protein [Bacilli bacterium]